MDNDALFTDIRLGHQWKAVEYFSSHPQHINLLNLRALPEDSKVWDELTPIHCAAKYGHLEMVRWLVEHGSEVYSNPFRSYPAVIVAAWEKRLALVDYFLKEIPEKAAGTNGLGVMCNLAGREGWADIVAEHIRCDPLVVHQRGWIGDTPLHWPAHNGFLEIVRMLLDAGANPNIEENNWAGGTPLHWASERHADIIQLLVERGADVNARVRPSVWHAGATPLIWCAKQRDDSAEAAAKLLELGADASLTDAEGKRAIDYAGPRVRAVLA